jgi:hypothetical protein
VNTPLNSDKFVSLLKTLTHQEKVKWFRRTVDPGFVYCVVNGELMQFETYGADGAAALPSSAIYGIGAHIRNLAWLWLEGSEEWESLLDLLRRAPVDDKAWPKAISESTMRLLSDLQSMADE